jgi:hypothetical protein
LRAHHAEALNMPAQSDWLPLSDILDRLDMGEISAASKICGRGQIPVEAIRSDKIPGSTAIRRSDILGSPERVEALLLQAEQTQVDFRVDQIIGYYDHNQMIIFCDVKVRWSTLAEALAAAGFASRRQTPGRSGPHPRLPSRIREATQRPGHKAPAPRHRPGPKSTADRIREAGKALMKEGSVPGETVLWERFGERLCRKLGVEPGTRGYGLDTIQNALRPFLKERQAKRLTAEITESAES